jgi:hypothetical protein
MKSIHECWWVFVISATIYCIVFIVPQIIFKFYLKSCLDVDDCMLYPFMFSFIVI